MANEPTDVFRLARTAKGYRARQKILRATADVLGERGLDNVTVLAICERADIGRTTLYNYFKDAEEAIDALMGEFAVEIQQQFEQIHGGRPRGVKRMAYCLRFILERAWRDPSWGKLAVSLRAAGPHFDDYVIAQVSLEIAAGLENGEMELSAPEANALPKFIASVIADTSRKLTTKELQLGDIVAVVLLILRASGVNATVAQDAASQKSSRALLARSWLVEQNSQ